MPRPAGSVPADGVPDPGERAGYDRQDDAGDDREAHEHELALLEQHANPVVIFRRKPARDQPRFEAAGPVENLGHDIRILDEDEAEGDGSEDEREEDVARRNE